MHPARLPTLTCARRCRLLSLPRRPACAPGQPLAVSPALATITPPVDRPHTLAAVLPRGKPPNRTLPRTSATHPPRPPCRASRRRIVPVHPTPCARYTRARRPSVPVAAHLFRPARVRRHTSPRPSTRGETPAQPPARVRRHTSPRPSTRGEPPPLGRPARAATAPGTDSPGPAHCVVSGARARPPASPEHLPAPRRPASRRPAGLPPGNQAPRTRSASSCPATTNPFTTSTNSARARRFTPG